MDDMFYYRSPNSQSNPGVLDGLFNLLIGMDVLWVWLLVGSAILAIIVLQWWSGRSTINNTQEEESQLSRYKQYELIETGAFGKIVRAKDMKHGHQVAIKILPVNDKNMEDLMCEVNAMKIAMECPFCIHYESSFYTTDTFYIVMELGYKDMFRFIYFERNKPLTEEAGVVIGAQLVLAIQFLHYNHILHRDIKPSNVLIDRGLHVRLADFGSVLTDWSGDMDLYGTNIGTTMFLAPEILTNKPYGASCDWWGLGMILYEAFHREFPFEAKCTAAIIHNIITKPLPLPNVGLSNAATDVLIRLLKKSADERLGSHRYPNVYKHPFFDKINWAILECSATFNSPSEIFYTNTDHPLATATQTPAPPTNMSDNRFVTAYTVSTQTSLTLLYNAVDTICQACSTLGQSSVLAQTSHSTPSSTIVHGTGIISSSVLCQISGSIDEEDEPEQDEEDDNEDIDDESESSTDTEDVSFDPVDESQSQESLLVQKDPYDQASHSSHSSSEQFKNQFMAMQSTPDLPSRHYRLYKNSNYACSAMSIASHQQGRIWQYNSRQKDYTVIEDMQSTNRTIASDMDFNFAKNKPKDNIFVFQGRSKKSEPRTKQAISKKAPKVREVRKKQ